MAIWNRITALVTGGAVATAAADAMRPEFEVLTQSAWRNEPHRVLDATTAAELRARETTTDVPGIDLEGVELADDAARSGVGSHRFNLLTELARTEPAVAQLLALRRRAIATGETEGIPAAEFRRLMRRQGYEAPWITEVEQLLHERLAPAQVALGVVRSILPDDGLLVTKLDTGPGNVPRYPVSSIDPVAEAGALGIDRERLRVMVGEIGLPMAADAAAQSLFRGILERTDFNAAIAEGDIRPEWAAAILEHARQIPSVADYVNAHLRGWITEAAMHEGAAKHGMSAADVDLLYLRTGRPAAPGQLATAAARGIDGPAGRPLDREQFLKAIAESDIRPEYGPLLWETRFLYPPLFQIGRLVQANAIDADTAASWAVKDRYPPEVVRPLTEYWRGLGGSTTDPTETKARTSLLTATHRSYVNGESDDAAALANLDVLGVPEAAKSAVLGLWANERELVRRQLTPAQVKKAWKGGEVNPATGAAWTRDDATARLIGMGYSANDASTFLDL